MLKNKNSIANELKKPAGAKAYNFCKTFVIISSVSKFNANFCTCILAGFNQKIDANLEVAFKKYG